MTEKVDWEVELGVIVGKRGANSAEKDAMKHVFGYTVINDVSARELLADFREVPRIPNQMPNPAATPMSIRVPTMAPAAATRLTLTNDNMRKLLR